MIVPTTTLRTALLTALAMLAFASNSLLCRIALRDTAIDAATFTAIRLASGALILVLILRSRGVRPFTGGSWPVAAMLSAYAAFFSLSAAGGETADLTGTLYAVLSGAVTSGLGYVLWYAALPALRPTSAATIQLSVPAIAAIGGVVLLAEPITMRLLLASVAILGGIALTIHRKDS